MFFFSQIRNLTLIFVSSLSFSLSLHSRVSSALAHCLRCRVQTPLPPLAIPTPALPQPLQSCRSFLHCRWSSLSSSFSMYLVYFLKVIFNFFFFISTPTLYLHSHWSTASSSSSNSNSVFHSLFYLNWRKVNFKNFKLWF